MTLIYMRRSSCLYEFGLTVATDLSYELGRKKLSVFGTLCEGCVKSPVDVST